MKENLKGDFVIVDVPTEKTLKFPDTYAQFRENVSDADKAVLAVVTLSGKPLGAYYAKDESGNFTLQRQTSLDNAATPNFSATAMFDANNLDHIAVKNAQGEIKGFFAVAQQDLTRYAPPGYDDPQKFVVNYLTPPDAVLKANHALASYIAGEYAPYLMPSEKAVHKTAEQQNLVLQTISGLADIDHTAGYALPDDNLNHTHGVGFIAGLMALAVNKAASEHNVATPYDDTLLKTQKLMGELHDLGKVQIPQHLNDYMLTHYLAPEDQHKSDAEKAAIHQAKSANWRDINQNHPLLTDIALTLINPHASQAAAEHHLSLFRDCNNEEERAEKAHLHLIAQDMSDGRQIPFIAQMFRVADVTDSCINGSRMEPARVLHELFAKKDETKFNGLSSIDPEILCFLLDRGVLDAYFQSKTLPPKALDESGSRPPDTNLWASLSEQQKQEYAKAKEEVLTNYHYAQRKNDIEMRILHAIAKEPLITEHQKERVQTEQDSSFVDRLGLKASQQEALFTDKLLPFQPGVPFVERQEQKAATPFVEALR